MNSMSRRVFWGPHYQTPIDNWPAALAPENGIEIVKLVGNFEMAREIKAVNPNCVVVIRHHNEDTGRWRAMAAESPARADEAMEEFLREFLDSLLALADVVDYAESLNEQYATHDFPGLYSAAECDRAFIRVLGRLAPSIKPVVFCAACGNPDHDEYSFLVDLARECEAAGGAFGYHSYWSVVKKTSTIASAKHIRDLHGRWQVIDDYLVARGIRVKWFNGEAGPIGASEGDPSTGSVDPATGLIDPLTRSGFGYWQFPNDGWRDDRVWNGQLSGYVSDLDAWDDLIMQARAYWEGRYLGYVLFTSSTDQKTWKRFLLRPADWEVLAEHARTRQEIIDLEEPEEDVDMEPVEIGIDVSSNQGEIDFDKAAEWRGENGEYIGFIIIRGSIGSGGKDVYFERNWEEAGRVGWKRTMYHLFKPDQEGKTQAENFIKVMGDRIPDFDIGIDDEIKPPTGQSNVLTTTRLLEINETISSLFLKPMMYTSPGWWNAYITRGSGAGFKLWIADPDAQLVPDLPVDWSDWFIRQYSWKGKVDGVAGTALLDKTNWSEQEFEEYCESYRKTVMDLRGIEPEPEPDPEPAAMERVVITIDVPVGTAVDVTRIALGGVE